MPWADLGLGRSRDILLIGLQGRNLNTGNYAKGAAIAFALNNTQFIYIHAAVGYSDLAFTSIVGSAWPPASVRRSGCPGMSYTADTRSSDKTLVAGGSRASPPTRRPDQLGPRLPVQCDLQSVNRYVNEESRR